MAKKSSLGDPEIWEIVKFKGDKTLYEVTHAPKKIEKARGQKGVLQVKEILTGNIFQRYTKKVSDVEKVKQYKKEPKKKNKDFIDDFDNMMNFK